MFTLCKFGPLCTRQRWQYPSICCEVTDTAASSDDITALQLHTQCASGHKQQPHTATAPTPKHPAICICQSHSANTQYAGIADTTNPHHPPPNPPIRRGWLQSDLHTVLKKEKRSLILSPVHSIQAPAMFPAACECLLAECRPRTLPGPWDKLQLFGLAWPGSMFHARLGKTPSFPQLCFSFSDPSTLHPHHPPLALSSKFLHRSLCSPFPLTHAASFLSLSPLNILSLVRSCLMSVGKQDMCSGFWHGEDGWEERSRAAKSGSRSGKTKRTQSDMSTRAE